MSTRQVTLSGEFREELNEAETRTCPLCGGEGIPNSQLPHHIASDACETDAKEIHYGNR